MKKKKEEIDYYISAQPDNDYFIWQLLVQMNNFRKHGIEEKALILLSYNPKIGINPNAISLQQTKANLFFYPDDRTNEEKVYIPSIRPNLFKKFFQENKIMMENSNYLYHDSDIIFNRIPDVKIDKKILLSDTVSYVGAEYIKSKSYSLFEEMCAVVGIKPNVVISNELNSGGAQYLITKKTPLDSEFWMKVEKDSLALFNLMNSQIFNEKVKFDLVKRNLNHFNQEELSNHINSIVKNVKNLDINNSNYETLKIAHLGLFNPIQAWTADMWAVLWNLWLRGYKTSIDKELEFSWATSHIDLFSKTSIMHNAGVGADSKNLFFKGNFIMNNPFNIDFTYVSKDFCSIKYVEEIIETGNDLKIRKI